MPTEKNIKTPELLYEYFEAYKKKCKENPKFENCYSARLNDYKPIPREIPITMNGFEIYLRKSELIAKLDDYIFNKDDRYTEYAVIIRAIQLEIYEDKYSGAAAGIFNQNIIARDLGLTDKKEIKAQIEQPLFPEEDNDKKS